MNRLIIIGNGFDLAHGLKTSYCNFIEWYILKAVETFFSSRAYVDSLLKIQFKYEGRFFSDIPKVSLESAFSLFKKLQDNEYVNVEIQSRLLSDTLSKIKEINWVDLETTYFHQLLKCKDRNEKFVNAAVVKLNSEFNFMKSKLEEYLTEIESQTELCQNLLNVFYSPVCQEDIVTANVEENIPQRIMILNFNYTSTVEIYKKQCEEKTATEINYIHGKLGDKSNPIIFGFGDEYDSEYLKFELINNKNLMAHIKSFGYFTTSNYHRLVRFIKDAPFQVFILGHSLGLSDRTMLKQIFEHEECKSIKVFYYQMSKERNDFNDKIYEIYKHVSNKISLRNKVVPFSLSYAMPQPIPNL